MNRRESGPVTGRVRETAYHEAGHFVAADILAATSYRGGVTMRPDREEGLLGYSQSEAPWTPEMVADDVLVSLAGHAAAKLFNAGASPESADSDTEQAREGLRLLEEEDNEHEWRAKADAFAVRHRKEIEALASELLRFETISDPFEAELIVDVVRGDATEEDVARYPAVRPS